MQDKQISGKMVKRQKTKRVIIAPRKKKNSETAAKREMTRLGSALRTLGGLGGTAIGSMMGMGATGGNLGTGIGAAISKWLGSGDYVVSANSITQRASAGQVPSMHREGQSIVVRHKEFLTEVRGATSFTIRNELFINPGLAVTFPWLSALAAQYSQYKIKGLVYHYVPTSGNAVSSTNAALGTVMLQTSYRATEALPTSKVEMLNEYWSSEAKPSEEFCHPIECDPKENPFNIQYVRTGELPDGENQLMYDLGRTVVAVSGQQDDDRVLGDLWVTYEIELKKPVLTGLNNQTIQTYAGTNSSSVGSGNPFGLTAGWKQTFNSMPSSVTFTTNTITFGRGTVGTYQVVVYYSTCTRMDATGWSITNGTLLPVVAGTFLTSSQYSSGTGQAVVTGYFTVDDPGIECVLTLALNTCDGSPRVRVVITECNPEVRVNT
jgi:hypothetical protein